MVIKPSSRQLNRTVGASSRSAPTAGADDSAGRAGNAASGATGGPGGGAGEGSTDAATDGAGDGAGSDRPAVVTPRAGYRVEALAKGLRVLSLFDQRRTVLTLSEIVAGTGFPMPTAFRLAATLEAEGYLVRAGSGAYQPGPRVLGLGFAALSGMSLVDVATAPLLALARSTGETVNLGIRQDAEVLYLVRLRNRDLVTANIHVGSRLPAVHSSLGKVLLANLDPAVRDALLAAGPLPAGGPRAARSVAQVRAGLDEVARRGWAVQDEEVAYGLRSVAAPVRDRTGEVLAAINIAVPAADYPVTRLESELLPEVLRTAREISALLGAPEAPGGQGAQKEQGERGSEPEQRR